MVPDLDLQLQVAIKALTDTVSPAVDTDNKMAVEQLHLVIGTLSMVRTRLPSARRFTRRLLEDAVQMGQGIVAAVKSAGGDSADLIACIAHGQEALTSPELDTFELDEIRAALNARIVAVIAGASAALAPKLGKFVLEASKKPVERQRAWCLPSGFEANPGAISAFETLL